MFGLSAALTGGIIGLVVGVISFEWISPRLIDWLEAQKGERDEVMRKLRWTDLVFYPAVGYLIGLYYF